MIQTIPVPVTQADREAAASVTSLGPSTRVQIRECKYDHLPVVQAFARHRLASVKDAQQTLADFRAAATKEHPAIIKMWPDGRWAIVEDVSPVEDGERLREALAAAAPVLHEYTAELGAADRRSDFARIVAVREQVVAALTGSAAK